MKCIENISEVNDYAINEDGVLLFVQNGHTVKQHLQFGSSRAILNSDVDISNLETNKSNMFWANHTGEKVKSFYGRIGESEVIENSYVIKEIKDDFIYCLERGEGKKYDLSGSLQWRIQEKFHCYLIADPYFFFRSGKKDKIVCLNNEIGVILWQFQLPKIELLFLERSLTNIYISDILGFYGQYLWIVLNVGHVIGLSVGDGSIKYHLKAPINAPAVWGKIESFSSAAKSLFDEEEGKIFGIENESYWEIELNTPEKDFLYFDISKSCQQNELWPQIGGGYFSWLKHEIFICQKGLTPQPSFVGIFDRNVKEIIWTSHEMNPPEIFMGLRKIEFSKSCFAVLDEKNNLKILEK